MTEKVWNRKKEIASLAMIEKVWHDGKELLYLAGNDRKLVATTLWFPLSNSQAKA